MLNDLQRDVLKEHINVFLGKAANMLSEMAGQRVLLSVPEIAIINLNDKNINPQDEFKLFSHGHIVSSSMKFGNDFSGRALLIFPASKAKLLVDACMGEYNDITAEQAPTELVDTDFDVLREISNVILNSIVGEFGNLIGTKLVFSIPDIELVFVSENEQQMYLKNNVYMLMLYTNFTLADAQVSGVIIVALGMDSLNMLIKTIDEIIGAEYE